MVAIVEIDAIEAERIAGCRLDRRRKYAKHDDESPCEVSGARVFELCCFTSVCSGCSYGDPSPPVGMGCRECGYTGKVRQQHWVPSMRAMWPNMSGSGSTGE